MTPFRSLLYATIFGSWLAFRISMLGAESTPVPRDWLITFGFSSALSLIQNRTFIRKQYLKWGIAELCWSFSGVAISGLMYVYPSPYWWGVILAIVVGYSYCIAGNISVTWARWKNEEEEED